MVTKRAIRLQNGSKRRALTEAPENRSQVPPSRAAPGAPKAPQSDQNGFDFISSCAQSLKDGALKRARDP